MHRIFRSPDGQVFLGRLKRVKEYKQDMADTITEHGPAMQHQGQIREIKEIMREFGEADAEAVAGDRRPRKIDRQKRF